MNQIFDMFSNMLGQLFGLLNSIVFYDSNSGMVIRYGWLIIAFTFFGFIISMFWRGAKQ